MHMNQTRIYFFPDKDNNLVFSERVTKESVDDKIDIPIGVPNLPVRTNVRKFSTSLNTNSSNF